MGKILVFTEASNGKLKRSSLELLTAAKKSGLPFLAAIAGSQVGAVTAALSATGATEVHTLEDAKFDQYNPELFTSALTNLIAKSGATMVLASASSLGKDLFPRVAARLKSAVLSDCTELHFEGDKAVVKRPVFSGKAFQKAMFDQSPVQFVLMRANQLPADDLTGGSATVTKHAAPAGDLKTLIKDIVKGTSEKMDLTEANVIVSGGRGLKEAGNFKLLNDLADVLGATVGASRAVVDAGWFSHGMQVGQTGKTVAPSLYIAVGISGAIQHLAGMSGSKVIVAINSDPSAPIFQKATYGIAGDLFEVLPKLTEEFKKALHK
ncbi:MAG: electron transfer flavoprotein subunit alpha/FixB family protein [Bdellovibrio sp.]